MKARFYAVDSWDNEPNAAQFWIDGTLRWGQAKAFPASTAPGWVSASVTPAPWGNNSNTTHGYWNVEAALGLASHKANTLALQFAAGLDQVVADESFAFSHVNVAIRSQHALERCRPARERSRVARRLTFGLGMRNADPVDRCQ